jgi:hypothetical protein
MKKKLAIVGRGTVGCLAVSYFLRWTDWDIEWIYDPEIEPAAVGEGTTLVLPYALFHNVDFDGRDMDNISATVKMGIWKRNWGTGNEFYHTFPAGAVGMHFNAVQFQKYMFDKLSKNDRIKHTEGHASDYENLHCDYVMVCTGSPNALDAGYMTREHIPVNAAYVNQCPWDYAKFNYSVTFAKKHGWVFGIPLQNRCAIGYIYNSNFTSLDEIKEDVQDVLDEFGLTPNVTRELRFRNYSKKINFTEKVCYNGNASFFLEPLEATSTGFADSVIRLAHSVWGGQMTPEYANELYQQSIDETESIISLHYYAGSVYNSAFWDNAQKVGEEQIVNDFKNHTAVANIIKHSMQTELPYGHDVGPWNTRSFRMNVRELGLTDKITALIEKYKV